MARRVRLSTLLVLLLAACVDGPPTDPGSPGISLQLVSGNGQEGTVGTELPEPLVVRAVGPDGRVLRNHVINFRVAEGGGSVFAGAANTNQHGMAQEYWTLGPAAGPNVLEVRAVDPTSGAKYVFATFTATGLPVPVASVTVSPAQATIAERVELELNLTLHDTDGNELTDAREAVWTSGDESIATVSAAGVVTGVSAGGPVTVTATVEGQSGEAAITVIPSPVASVEVSPEEATLDIDETVQLTAILRDVGGHELDGREITWTSSNEGAATVSETGLVTAEAGGSAVITATSEGKAGVAHVTVNFPSAPVPAPVASITVTPTGLTRAVGESVTLTATLFDAGGLRVTGTHLVSWSVTGSGAFLSSTQTTAVNGVTTVQVMSTASGTKGITATVAPASGSATISFLAPDTWEPNNTGGAAAFIGSAFDDGGSVSLSATLHSTTDQDWYRVRAVERSSVFCFPGTSQDFRLSVSLSNIPAGRDYDLEVRMGSPGGSQRVSQLGGSSSELVNFDFSGTCGSDDSRDFYIRVYRWSGEPSGQSYFLSTTFRRR